MPDCVLLLDEIEKANRVVWNTFLQVFDAGRLTDSRGLTADFANTVIVMTSNLGAAAAAGPGLGFGSSSGSADLGRQKIMSAVKEAMAPELINRIDEFVIFDPLGVDAIEQIADHELAAVKERLLINGWTVSYEPEVVHHIASTSYDPAFGARHLQRNIERGFLSLVASAEDKTAHVVVSNGQLALGKTTQRKKAAKQRKADC
jgi:ATP-dependent Clp protease ATP-binding subunit ClpA